MAPTARATAGRHTYREKGAVTRHGRASQDLAAPEPRATCWFAPAFIIAAVAGSSASRLQQRRCPIRSHGSLFTPAATSHNPCRVSLKID